MLKCSESQLELIKFVCIKMNADWREVASRRGRRQNINKVRFVLYRVFRLFNLSYPQIGMILNKNHTTIIHGENMCLKDPELNQKAFEYFNIFKQKKDKLIIGKTVSEISKFMIDKDKFKILYNKGFSLIDIAYKLNLDKEKTAKIFNYLNSRCKKKLVPDYKNNSYRYIFL